MMNREEALQWLVDNHKEWPKDYKTCSDHPHGWYWYPSVDFDRSEWLLDSLIFGLEAITRQDWLAAKQPAPITRAQALAWLVGNVKVWPGSFPDMPDIGWMWVEQASKAISLRRVGEVGIFKEDWQAAQPAPAPNKPSWADAPEWAKSLCQHEDGSWVWTSFSVEDVYYEDHGIWRSNAPGKWMCVAIGNPNPNWRDTLEHRPVAEESTPIDTRQADSIAAGEALTEAATITPGNVTEIIYSDLSGLKFTEYGREIIYNKSFGPSPVRHPLFGDAMELGGEQDPSGLSSSAPGAKLDAGKVRPDLILSGMPRALLAVAEVGTFGIGKYSENGWLSVPDGIKRYTAAMDRHRLKEGIELLDADSDLKHVAHLAWNALARLELMLRD